MRPQTWVLQVAVIMSPATQQSKYAEETHCDEKTHDSFSLASKSLEVV